MADPVPPPPQLGRPGTGILRSPAELPTTAWPWSGGFRVDTEAAAEPVAKLAEALDRLNHTILRLERDAEWRPPEWCATGPVTGETSCRAATA